MPSAFTHAFAAFALCKASGVKRQVRFWVLSVFCAVVPDVDVVSFYFHVERGSMFGHRGLTHSLLFAVLLALVVVWLGFRKTPAFSQRWWKLLLYFFIVTASHGLLDALTNGGSGVAFFASKRIPHGHAIWHLFVLGGSICHFFAVVLYVLPAKA